MLISIVAVSFLLQLCWLNSLNASKHSTLALQGKLLSEYSTHETQLSKIVSDIKSRSPNKKITLKRKPQQSHCPRPHSYKSSSIQLDISKFDKLLNVEYFSENAQLINQIPHSLRSSFNDGEIIAVADAQALMSMEQMVDALLPLGLMPAVVPEFKGITVGGSLQGLAAESTSFKYGFVHDAIIGFEAVLSDGKVLWCSAQSNADLFYSLPGSFGSLAICTRVKILCVKAAPYVTVTCTEHESQPACVDHMSRLQDLALRRGRSRGGSESIPDFLEGIAFRGDQVATVTAAFTSEEDVKKGSTKVQYCNGIGNKWFFNQVRDSINTARRRRDRGPRAESCFVLPLKDYLFRHDQGSFWMASYRIPQVIGRLMGPLLDSTNMFRLATALPWLFPKSTIVLQDFILPRGNVKAFFQSMQEQLQVWPVWLLPMRNIPSKGSIFASPDGLNGEHLCNVGAYGIPGKKYNFIPDNKKLEDLLYKHNGRKVYYSHAFYLRDFFYNILYNGQKYFTIRKKYCGDEALPEIFDKIITKNGKL